MRIAGASTRDPGLSGFRLLSWSEQSFARRIELANLARHSLDVAGGRNIGNEYFMVHDGANSIDLDVFAVGKLLPRLGKRIDRYCPNGSFDIQPVAA